MKRLIIITGIMLLSVSALAFQFTGSGGSGKRYNVTVSQTQIKGPAWISQGVYSSTATRQHAVTYAGSTWIALVNNTNQTPSDGSVYWAKYISKGDTGATGPQGPAGSVTAASGLNITQRQMSSGTITLLPPVANDPTGIRGLDITVAKGSNRAGHLQYSSGKLLVDHVEISGTGGGGSAFTTVKRSVLTNMSSGRLYEPGAFAKHTLPTAAGSQSVRIFANATSAQVSVNTGAGVVKDFGGITSTAGYSVRVPKGSVYEFFSTAADSTWYAIKQAGSAISEYAQAFLASLGWDLSTKDYGSVASGTEVYQKFTLTNNGNAASASQSVAFVNQSSCFRSYSSTCGSSLNAGANCTIGVAFKPSAAGTWGGTKLRATATGIGPYDVALSGTGTSAVAEETINPTSVALSSWAKNGGASDNVTTLTDTDDTTYHQSTATSASINMQMVDTAAATIAGVKLCARVQLASAGSHNARFRFYDVSSYQSFSSDPFVISNTAWADVCTTEMTLNPYTSGVWSASALNALSWYIFASSTSVTPYLQVSKVWGIVRY